MTKYDVIVVGGGHAGIEASLASARMGCMTILLTMNIDTIGLMSCNPAIGGIGKGQLVKELDALGGEMGKNTDKSAVQYRQLNTKKGQAVHSSRAQTDRQLYKNNIRWTLEQQKNLFLYSATVTKILTKGKTAVGVETSIGERFYAKSIVLAPGTFLSGLVHIGLVNFPAGRLGESPANELAENLRKLGFNLGRFKTGTPARLDGRTINFKKLEPQYGDEPPIPFSFWTKKKIKNYLPCYITYTNSKTHQIIKSGLNRSPLYTGVIKGKGVRYCPSIEDKIMKFPDRERHQIFIEPEGLNTIEYYPNGISTSLPLDIQIKMLRSIDGLEAVEIFRPGYAIEHDYVDPTQLKLSLETKLYENLFFAGQINGTTGYEEAAAQGLIAGINAALKAKDKSPFILSRADAYIGVMIDDLVTKGTNEPYRMFTSRVEYRLLLREDNADLRLTPKGYELGLIPENYYRRVIKKQKQIQQILNWLKTTRINPSNKINNKLKEFNSSPIKHSITLEELLRRPEIRFNHLLALTEQNPNIGQIQNNSLLWNIEIEVKYQGYIERTLKDIEKFQELEDIKIPDNLDFYKVHGLSNEVKEKLTKQRPNNLGQAQRISGVTPAAIFALMVYLKRLNQHN
ncbi:MAG: tRNA uridine-5-carboxymethylaminomethyl(34) synthesis enzyme MnmG [candidate division WOR-3 bacterium]